MKSRKEPIYFLKCERFTSIHFVCTCEDVHAWCPRSPEVVGIPRTGAKLFRVTRWTSAGTASALNFGFCPLAPPNILTHIPGVTTLLPVNSFDTTWLISRHSDPRNSDLVSYYCVLKTHGYNKFPRKLPHKKLRASPTSPGSSRETPTMKRPLPSTNLYCPEENDL